MAVVNTSRTFTNNEQITSTKLNQIMDESSFISDAIVPNQGLQITAGGQMQIPNSGITTALIGNNQVTTAKIANSNITTAKIADSNVTTAKIADSNVTTAKIADSNVTTIKIANENVTASKLDGAQSGSAPIFGFRAWVTFDMGRNSSGGSDTANTNRFIYSSGNVTSVQKIDTGRFQVNFTTAMPNSNYAYLGGARTLSGDNSGDATIGRPNSTGNSDGAKTTSSIRLDVVDAGASFFNSPEVCIAIIG
jgi:hypothetical protein